MEARNNVPGPPVSLDRHTSQRVLTERVRGNGKTISVKAIMKYTKALSLYVKSFHSKACYAVFLICLLRLCFVFQAGKEKSIPSDKSSRRPG
jgi:hypothetical protein